VYQRRCVLQDGTCAVDLLRWNKISDITQGFLPVTRREEALAMTDSRPDEMQRLEALRRYQLLDTPPDGAFDRVTALAARHFRTPICLVSLLDEDRIWFKSRYGLDAQEIPRTPGLCGSATFTEDAYVVRDAVTDPRTLTNPLVVGALGLRFYAAAPLVTHNGFRLGTFNVIDFAPREFGPDETEALKQFAGIVMDQMEVRLASMALLSSLSSAFEASSDKDRLLTVCAWTRQIRVGGEWLSFENFIERRLGFQISHGIHPDAVSQFLEGGDGNLRASRPSGSALPDAGLATGG